MNIPLQITLDERLSKFTVDHPKRKHLNVITVRHIRGEGVAFNDVRFAKPVSRESYLERDKDILYLGDVEYQRATAHWNSGDEGDIQRYFRELLKACGLKSWIDSVS
jgi:hypothetical protein